MGPTGDVLEPLGPRTLAEAEEAFHEQAEALREGGAQVAWIETMFADNELEAAVRGAMRAGLPFVATMTFDTGGHTMMGIRPSAAMRLARSLPGKPIAFGANCGVGPAQLLDSVLGLAQGAAPGDIIVAKSNCGLPVMGDDMKVRYDGTPGDHGRICPAGARRRGADHRRLLRHHGGARPGDGRGAVPHAQGYRAELSRRSSGGSGRFPRRPPAPPSARRAMKQA